MSIKHILLIILVFVLTSAECRRLPEDRPKHTNTLTFVLDGESFYSTRSGGYLIDPGDGMIDVKEEQDSIIVRCVPKYKSSTDAGLLSDKADNEVICIFRMAIPCNKVVEGNVLSGEDLKMRIELYSFLTKEPFTEYTVRYNVSYLRLSVSYVGFDKSLFLCNFQGSGRIAEDVNLGINGQTFSLTDGVIYFKCPHTTSLYDYFELRHRRKKLIGSVPSFGFTLTGKEYYANDGFGAGGWVRTVYNEAKDSVIVYAEPRISSVTGLYQREGSLLYETIVGIYNDPGLNSTLYERCLLIYRMAIPVDKISEGATLSKNDIDIQMFWYTFFSNKVNTTEYRMPYIIQDASLTFNSAGLGVGDKWDCSFSCSGHIGENEVGLVGETFSLEDGYLECKFPCPPDPEYIFFNTYEELLAERNKVLP